MGCAGAAVTGGPAARDRGGDGPRCSGSSFLATGRSPGGRSERHGPLSALAEHLSALPAQLSLWVRPSALSIVHAPGDGWVSPALGAALLVAAVGAAWALRRRLPTASFAVGWALVALVPTHTLLARADVVTDRSLHLAWAGPAVGLGAALGWLSPQGASRPARALLASAVSPPRWW